jgi:aspartyl-tRNA(Asn)/glutamyl-tRNA(Gln) amidotransferase subunit A
MALITELRAKLDRRELSAVDLTLNYLEKIKKLDGTVNAYLHVNEELALKAAEKAQERINRGKASALTGIPVAVKDNLCTTDMPTTCASRMLEGYIPPYDATVIARLRESGAVILGKVNMDEFAMGASTRNSYYKKTANPYDVTRVPGGSSGGSAASVAAGLAVASLGSDTGGSIRQPAAFCGVTGIRPTYGRVPRYGCVAFASSLDQVGPIAGSARDCALMLETISGADSRDQTCNGE